MALFNPTEEAADKITWYIASRTGGEEVDQKTLAGLVEEAINFNFGSKEQFQEMFLSRLTPEMLQMFFMLLEQKLAQKKISARVLAMIRATLKDLGIKDFQDANPAERVRPSSTIGTSPYGRSGGKGKR